MTDLLKDCGVSIFDIRDFFSDSWVGSYKNIIIPTRKQFKFILEECDGGDGCPAWNSEFIEHMEKLLNKDYSYLYFGMTDGIKMDNSFLMDCLDYFDKNNIDETYTNEDIPGFSTLSGGLYHMCPLENERLPSEAISEYLLMTDEINIKLMKEISSEPLPYEVGDWKGSKNWLDEKRHKHLNVFEKNAFMPIHNDSNDEDVRFICQNYPNIDRVIGDGSLFRYFIEDEAYDVLTNYTTVIVFDYSKDIEEVSHLVTKNNIDEYRYSLYNTYRK